MKIILPTKIPPITGAPITAYPLGIALTNPQNYGWLYSHYINWSSKKKDQMRNITGPYLGIFGGWVFGGVHPINMSFHYKDKIFITKENIVDHLIKIFSNGMYIFTYINHKHFLGKHNYNHHNILIYGIDIESKNIYVWGYKDKLFQQYIISIESFITAFFDEEYDNMQKCFILLKANPVYSPYSYEDAKIQFTDYYNLRLSFDKIDNYIDNKAGCYSFKNMETEYEFITESQKKENYYHGFDCYEFLEWYVMNYRSLSDKIDMRVLRPVMEHKNMLFDRFTFYKVNEIYEIDYEKYLDLCMQIKSNANIMFQKASKNIITEADCSNLVPYLEKIREDEYKLLSDFMKYI